MRILTLTFFRLQLRTVRITHNKIIWNCLNNSISMEGIIVCRWQGRIQDFHLAGAQKIICAHAHFESEPRRPLRPRCKVLEALGVFNALSCYFMSLIFKHSDTRWDFKRHRLANFFGGRAYCAPVWIRPGRGSAGPWGPGVLRRIIARFLPEVRVRGGVKSGGGWKKTFRPTDKLTFWHSRRCKELGLRGKLPLAPRGPSPGYRWSPNMITRPLC